MIIGLYLAAIVAANLIAAVFGPASSVLTSFLFIGATLTLRDRIHDQWKGRLLTLRMATLIGVGGGLSYLVNADAGRVALASCLAFAAAETVDGLLYHGMRRWSWMRRVNGSNAGSAAVDSLIFPMVAFGGFLPLIVLGQFIAKTVGGAVWAWVLRPKPETTCPNCRAPVRVSTRLMDDVVPYERVKCACAEGWGARLAVLACLLFAVPARGQVVSVDVGALRTPFATEPVVETYIATAPAFGVRAYSIISWTPIAEYDAHKPTIVTQLALPLISGARGWLSVDAGATWLPYLDYRPEPTVGGYAGARLPAGFHAFGLVSAQPLNEWGRSYVIGLARTLYFRR